MRHRSETKSLKFDPAENEFAFCELDIQEVSVSQVLKTFLR